MVQAVITRSSRLLAGSIVVIALVHSYLFFSSAYWAYRFLDTPMHFACGAWFAFFAGHYLFDRGRVSARTRAHEALVILSFVTFVGVLWEFHEFVADLYIRNRAWITQAGVGDTMGDLLSDILGGTIAVILRLIPWQKLSQSSAVKN